MTALRESTPSSFFKGVLFDLDGTLLDTLKDLSDAANAVLAAHGFPSHPMDAYRHLVGDGVRVLFQRALPEKARGDDQLVDACLASMKLEYGSRWKASSRPYPGILELLDQLHAAKFKLGVLSNKDHDFTLKTVEQFFGLDRFDSVLGFRAGIPKKPHPGAALEIAAQWNLNPSQIAYLGDTDTDMQTAVAAGMRPIGVLWGFRSREELIEHGAVAVVEHPSDLLELPEFWKMLPGELTGALGLAAPKDIFPKTIA